MYSYVIHPNGIINDGNHNQISVMALVVCWQSLESLNLHYRTTPPDSDTLNCNTLVTRNTLVVDTPCLPN